MNPKQRDRFGLAARKPTGFDELPMFAAEKIETSRSYGDICVQACADDPQVAVHAIRNLARIGMGVAVRWSQLGFGRTASTSTSQATPRNLFGFRTEPTTCTPRNPNCSTNGCGSTRLTIRLPHSG